MIATQKPGLGVMKAIWLNEPETLSSTDVVVSLCVSHVCIFLTLSLVRSVCVGAWEAAGMSVFFALCILGGYVYRFHGLVPTGHLSEEAGSIDSWTAWYMTCF